MPVKIRFFRGSAQNSSFWGIFFGILPKQTSDIVPALLQSHCYLISLYKTITQTKHGDQRFGTERGFIEMKQHQPPCTRLGGTANNNKTSPPTGIRVGRREELNKWTKN